MTNLTEMLSKFINSNTALSSSSGTLPSQTVTNPREHVNAITTRSGKTYEEPLTPLVPTSVVYTPLEEPEQNPKTSMDKVQKPSSESTAQVPPSEDHDSIFIEIPKQKAKNTVQEPISPEPNSYQPKLPYPERMKVREKDKPSAHQSRFIKLFKQLRLEIGLRDALIEMPKFNKWLSTLLRNKEKLEEIAITTVNVECSAIILNKVPEKLEDPEKFLIPCALQELDRTNALADSRASINLLPHSIYKQLGLGALKPTRITLELPSLCLPLVRILQKSQEIGQNRTITNTGTELSVQKPKNAIKSYTSPNALISQFPKGNDTRGLKKAHKEWGFYTKTLTKEAQMPLTHGFHVGNPCAPKSNPKVQDKHQMIEGMKGQDYKERASAMRT
ncbi:hypothetical protein Tco_0984421 [Tanacetum coccineum]